MWRFHLTQFDMIQKYYVKTILIRQKKNENLLRNVALLSFIGVCDVARERGRIVTKLHWEGAISVMEDSSGHEYSFND